MHFSREKLKSWIKTKCHTKDLNTLFSKGVQVASESKRRFSISLVINHLDANLNHNEIPCYIYSDGYNKKKVRQYKVLRKMGRNWNSHSLLVGMSSGAAAAEKGGSPSKA